METMTQTNSPSKMTKGTVRWFNDAKGYGFVTPNDRPLDVFAHYSAIVSDGFKTLREGQPVTFELVEGPKGPQAFNIIPEVFND